MVQHLYVLHRGETSSVVQDIHFSTDSRWITVSTLRGTAHTFPITPYGGPISVRTHTDPLVANKLSRFHTTAGLDEANLLCKSGPDVTIVPDQLINNWANTCVGDVIRPIKVESLAIKPPLSAHRSPDMKTPAASQPQRLFRPQEGGTCLNAYFSTALTKSRSPSGSSCPLHKPAICESLFLLTGSGSLLEHKLTPIPVPPVQGIASQESPIQLNVHGLSEWCLIRDKDTPAFEPPLSKHSPLLVTSSIMRKLLQAHCYKGESTEDLQTPIKPVKNKEWLTNVELVTYAPPGRRLWMGPQFCFKTYQRPPSVDFSTLVYSSSPRSNNSEEGDRHIAPQIDLIHDDVTKTSSLPIHVRRSEPVSTSYHPEGWASAEDTPSDEILEVYGSWKDLEPISASAMGELGNVRDLISDAMEPDENKMVNTMYQSTRTDSPLTSSASPEGIYGSMQSLEDLNNPQSELFNSDQ
ncbi:Breast carcinoma-amplified sequence 3 isoform X6 [Oopsacas minuta]|uniref:Breast carcinoma-amplified sequence 3 isoform X6 n=1 Tax=Oopsacas minuta TaxID=111878 RepID=A0AAV7K9D8_9METZ|nr:Breast carcinoma-amplified sequence 3 isoform X6 [Oopsacas minuta]